MTAREMRAARPQPWRAVWTTSESPPVVIPCAPARRRTALRRVPVVGVMIVGAGLFWGAAAVAVIWNAAGSDWTASQEEGDAP